MPGWGLETPGSFMGKAKGEGSLPRECHSSGVTAGGKEKSLGVGREVEPYQPEKPWQESL
jgi:hypothetical protein